MKPNVMKRLSKIPTGDNAPASFYDLLLQQGAKPYVTAKDWKQAKAQELKFLKKFFKGIKRFYKK